jgi:hypothetical protein
MYPNLEDKEFIKTFPSQVLSDKFGSDKEKSSTVKEKHKTKYYEWNTEVRIGHGILYTSSASQNRHSTGFREISAISSPI